jgi:hypothetical protein
MPQQTPPTPREAMSDEPAKWVCPGQAEYEASLRALEQRNVTWKPSGRCEQEVSRLFPNVPLVKAKQVLERKALAALKSGQLLRRLRQPGEDDQFGVGFRAGKYDLFMHWGIVDESITEPAIEVTSCHEDGQ